MWGHNCFLLQSEEALFYFLILCPLMHTDPWDNEETNQEDFSKGREHNWKTFETSINIFILDYTWSLYIA